MFSFISAFVGLALAASPTASGQVTTVADQISPSTSTSQVVTASDTTKKTQNQDDSDIIIASITFSSNGGTGYYGDMIIGAGNATGTLPSSGFSRDGYKFSGWNTSADGTGRHFALGQSITANQIVAMDKTGNIMLYAEWTKDAAPVSHTIEFNANGGTGSINAFTVEPGKQTMTPSNPFIRAEYDFTGWNTAPDGSGTEYSEGSFLTPTENMTLYAQWKKTSESFTITTNPNGGTGTAPATITALRDAILTAPANTYTKDGYEFTNWNTLANGGGAVIPAGSNFTVNGNIVLYAQWDKAPTVEKFKITFNENGGTGSVDAITTNENTAITLPANGFTRAGYEFLGWGKSETDNGSYLQPGESFTPSGDTALYAQWKLTAPVAVKYTVNFDGNESNSGTVDSIEGTQSDGIKLPKNEFTKKGYTFTGWNTDKDGKGTSYKVGDAFNPSENTTLYAQWSKDSNGNNNTNNGGNNGSNGNNTNTNNGNNNGGSSNTGSNTNNGSSSNTTNNGSKGTTSDNGSSNTNGATSGTNNTTTPSKTLQGAKDKPTQQNVESTLGKTGANVFYAGIAIFVLGFAGVLALIIKKNFRREE
jgi:uncharacterized repeat protein (TIGR02543 family)